MNEKKTVAVAFGRGSRPPRRVVKKLTRWQKLLLWFAKLL
jgi:hypothetical protein